MIGLIPATQGEELALHYKHSKERLAACAGGFGKTEWYRINSSIVHWFYSKNWEPFEELIPVPVFLSTKERERLVRIANSQGLRFRDWARQTLFAAACKKEAALGRPKKAARKK